MNMKLRWQCITHPASTARPELFAVVRMPDVRIAPKIRNPNTVHSLPTALLINESAAIGQINIKPKVAFTNMSSSRRIVDSEYVMTSHPVLSSAV